jgi:PAS domain S-box-containing protein
MTDRRPLILAIDDTPANLFTLGGALAAEFDLQIATSGEMGLRLAAESRPDLILLDVMMPDMDGYEVCQHLKTMPALRHIPVIFLTALSDSASEMKGLSLGAADYIAKPIGVEIARQRIRNVLEREQLRRELEAQLAERQRVQADLEESEKRFRHFFEKNSSVMLLIDPSSGAIKEANEAAVAYYGYSRSQLLGMSITAINTLSPEEVVQEMQAARREERGHFLFRHRLASGEIRDVEVYSSPIQTAAQPVLFSIIHDITERRRAEEMLRKLSVAVEQSPASVVITDLDACIQYVNRRFTEVTGYGADEVIGQNPNLLQSGMTSPDVYLGLWSNLTQGLAWKGELLNKRKNGELYWEESHLAPARDSSGVVTHYVAVKIDITQRKQAELALQQSHATLRSILDTTLDGYWRTDMQGRLLDVNPTYCRQSGYTREELLGMQIGDLDVNESDTFVAERIEWLIENGREIFETVHRRKDGSVWPVEVSTTYRDTDGGEIYVFMRDITARKQAEIDVARANNLLNEAIRSIAEGFTIYDENDRLMVCNEAYLDFYSTSRDLIVPGASFEEIVRQGAERGQYQDANGRVDEWVRERVRRHQSANGSHLEQLLDDGRWLLIIEDRTPSGYIVGNRIDITARKQAEAELERHRSRLEELVEERTAALLATEARASHLLQSSADGLYGVDNEGRITFINPAGCQMLGYRPDEVVGRSAHEVFHHSRTDGSHFPITECVGHHAVLRGEEVRVDNEVYWHSDGHAVPVMYAVHPMALGDSNKGAVISFVDMSEHRAAAEARERALNAAENLARVRSEFLSNMSHEIRTPLNGVLGFAQIGLRNADDGAKARNAFDKILSSGTRLLGVINDILDFSKIDAGKIHLAPTAVSLVDVMEQARELVYERATAKGLRFQAEYDPDLPSSCLIDELRLGQVLINLLSNAVKFTASGYVRLSAAREGDRLVFKVTDTGIGISDEQLALLFNPFQQADGSTTRRFGGTGLGLAISKRILELMGGDIRVDSHPGMGSIFTFSVPFHPAPEALPSVEMQADTGAAANKRLHGVSILVAEDDEINQMIFEENLFDDGARVVIVGNGREAIDRLQADGCHAYDVVLMDVQMPGMDGYEAVQRILAMAPALPVIGQTAHASTEERDKCLAAGMVAHIAKPIDPDALVELILKHVGPTVGR